MRALVCCCCPRTESPSPKAKDTVEIALTPQTVPSTTTNDVTPHGNSPTFEEEYVLRSIFGSMYNSETGTATTTAHDQTTPQSGDGSAIRKRVKPKSSSLQSYSGKVRKKLSYSHLSRRNTKNPKQSKEDHKLEEGPQAVGSNSHTTALEDILTNRSVSQGGYDSDARNIEAIIDSLIETPPKGSIKVSPGYLAKAVKALDGSTTQLQATLHTPRRDSTKGPRPRIISSVEICASKSRSEVGKLARSKSSRTGTRSSPDEVITPTRTTGRGVVELDRTESPKDALRRLISTKPEGSSHGHATTSGAPRLPSLDEAQDNWKLSFSAPRRLSSLRQTPEKNVEVDTSRGEGLELTPTRQGKKATQEQSVSPSDAANRMSLISSLDDSLVAQISRFFEYESPIKGQPARAVSPDDAHISPYKHQPFEFVPNVIRTDDHPRDTPAVTERANSQKSVRMDAIKSDQDDASFHLFNMRISQRLGSNSLDPAATSSNSAVTSDLHDRCASSSSMRNPLSACMPGVGATGHWRKLSDSSIVEQNRLFLGRRCLSDTGDDASSVYTNRDGQVSSSNHASRRSHISANKFPLPKQLCGGPSFHSSLRDRPVTLGVDHISVTHLSRAEDDSQTRPNTAGEPISTSKSTRAQRPTGGSVFGKFPQAANGPKESRFVEDFGAEDSPCSSQEDVETEGKREVPLCPTLSRSRDFGALQHRQSFSSTTRLSNNGWLPRMRARLDHSNTASRENVSQISLSSFGNQLAPKLSNPILDSAADIWERALRSAREERERGSEQSWAGSVEISDARRKKHDNNGKQKALSPYGGLGRRSPSTQDALRSVSPSYTDLKSPARGSLGSSLLLKSKKSIGDIFPLKDFSTWARFPSHTRWERNKAARSSDKVATRDFSSDITQTPHAQRLSSTPPKTPKGSWKRLRFRRRSKSLTFSHRASAKGALKKWSPLQMVSQNEFKPRAGRRTSVSVGGPLEYPELELIPGYANLSGVGFGGSADGSSEGFGVGIGGSTTMLLRRPEDQFERRQPATLPRKKGKRRFAFARPRRLDQNESTPPLNARDLREAIPKRADPNLSYLRRTINTTKSHSDPNLVLSLSSNPLTSESSARTLRPGTGKGLTSATAWSRVYADCLDPMHMNMNMSMSMNMSTPPSPPPPAGGTSAGMTPATNTMNSTNNVQALTMEPTATATEADGDRDGDEYVSVTFSNGNDHDDSHLNSNSNSNSNINRHVDCEIKAGTETEEGSGNLRAATAEAEAEAETAETPMEAVGMAQRPILGQGQRHRHRKERRILSAELRESTVDFRDKVEREEDAVRRGLMERLGLGSGLEEVR